MINFTVYSADCVGNSGNCLYPNKMIVADKESFIKATKMDHVTAKYKGNYRSKDNFESSDCIPLDCDNDHSDTPNEWVTPLDIAFEIPGVAFAVSYSRHHNLPKGDKSARPRFHIFFPKVIWRSASKFGNKVSNQEGYIPPEQYNSDCRLKPEDFSDVGQATVLATEYKDILRYFPSTDYMVYNGSFWEESKPKSQGVSQDLTERQLAEAEAEMKKAMDELVKNGGMEILVSVSPKKAAQMFNKQQAHAYEMYENASVYKKYAIKRRDLLCPDGGEKDAKKTKETVWLSWLS